MVEEGAVRMMRMWDRKRIGYGLVRLDFTAL